MSSGLTVNDSNFKQEVLDSDVPVLVDFWAEWCGPCRMLAPVVDEIAKEYEGRIKVCKLNVEEGNGTASSYSVMNIPTLMLFKGGEAVDKIVGAVPKNNIIERINMHI